MTDKRKWLEFETKFAENSYNGSSKEVSRFRISNSRVVLLSVHGVNHYSGPRDADFKVCDLWTGGLVEMLAHECDLSYFLNLKRDPSINPHKGKTPADDFLEILWETNPEAVILDIHGAKETEAFSFALGTSVIPFGSEQKVLIDSFVRVCEDLESVHRQPVRSIVNHPDYSARGRNTMTSRALKMGFKSVLQLEIIKSFRDPDHSNSNLTLQCLKNFIAVLNQRS